MRTWVTSTLDMDNQTAEALPPKLLEVEDLSAGYGLFQVLRKVSLCVREGEFVALLGPNGAGKTTTLRAIAGLVPTTTGKVGFRRDSILGLHANQRTLRGMSFISEDLNLFLGMSVRENLLLGAYPARRDVGKRLAARLEYALVLFPVLKERMKQVAGTLSGGERRMLGIARGLISDPILLLIDEPSLGLAPNVVHQVFCALEKLNRHGVAILLAEQNILRALQVSSRAYVLEQGSVALQGESRELLETDHVRKSYFGQL